MPQFSVACLDSGIINGSCENFEDCSNIYPSACTDILDSTQTVCAKPLSEPWFSEHRCTLRHDCRCAEGRWKKDRMYVSIKILRDCLSVYQIATSLIISSVQVIMLELSMCEAVGDETQDLIAETWSVKKCQKNRQCSSCVLSCLGAV